MLNKKVGEYIYGYRSCNKISKNCPHSDNAEWKDRTHIYKSCIFANLDLCPQCFEHLQEKVKGKGKDASKQPISGKTLNRLTSYERSNIWCIRGAATEDKKNCTPFTFIARSDKVERGWYWSKRLNEHCCQYHYDDENDDGYKKIDRKTFHKFLFRVDFSDSIYFNKHFFPIYNPSTSSSSSTSKITITEMPAISSSNIITTLVKNNIVRLEKECVMEDELLQNLKYLNGGNDYSLTGVFHSDFRSMHTWVAFDEEVGQKQEEEQTLYNHYGSKVIKVLKRYALVNCDSDNKELFGKVATALCIQSDNVVDKETIIDNAMISIEEYCAEKYHFEYLLIETLEQVSFPQPLINIIVQYVVDENSDFIKDLRVSMGFIIV
jgi:hypothetical protein